MASRVRVIMMQRNEGDMLVRWLSHYSGLFGIGNLSIMDNGTTDKFTQDVLHDAERGGAKIYWGYDTWNDFQRKGGHFGNVIRHWDAEAEYDFALPLDCDEFLAVFTEDGLVLDHAAILAEFARLASCRCALRIDMSLFNVPDRAGWFSPDRDFHKGFLPARSFASIDDGQHEPASRLAAGYETTRLTYLHWHNRSYESAIELARRKLLGLVDVFDESALLAYERTPAAPGAHLVGTLRMTAEQYAAKYDQDVSVFVPQAGFGSNFLLQSGHVCSWDARSYLAANPDVRAYALTPLHHYLRHGFRERRVLRGAN